jgi:glucose-6-phosphate 1-dehydrogenase
MREGLLHDKTIIIGITRSSTTVDELFQKVKFDPEGETGPDPTALETIRKRTTMIQMDLGDQSAYADLLQRLNDIEDENGLCMNRLYYLSIPPKAYLPIVGLLGKAGLNTSCQHGKAATRLLVEKPFGFDLESAQSLIKEAGQIFTEEQIFRIDHYMAKETVQNILTFRFKNPIFEAVWNNKHVSGIQIIAKQKIGIEGRAEFYEPLGALRDFIQSHLIQILGIIIMDKPEALDSAHIHASKQSALDQVAPVPSDQVSQLTKRGQYKGYREEVNNVESVTETFAEIKVQSLSDRWRDVPITLLTGKGLDEHTTEIRVDFRGSEKVANNELLFRIQPNEGLELDLVTKKPGYTDEAQSTAMEFSYKNGFNNNGHPNAYERVLVDAVRGDHTLFATSDEILASWRIVQPVLDAWSKNPSDLEFYEQGSAGP